jgi:hypothetical protein
MMQGAHRPRVGRPDAMKLLFEVRDVPVFTRGDRDVGALVRVRGIDARVRGRGYIAARFDPQAVVVRANGSVSRLALPHREPLPTAAAFAAPALAYLVMRTLMARRRKR